MVEESQKNALKFAALAQYYPEHGLKNLVPLLSLSPVDINIAIWRAQDLGYIKTENDGVQVLFSRGIEINDPDVENLKSKILYALRKVAETEQDMEESIFASWFAGYKVHDIIIAVKQLESEGLVAKYKIVDGKGKQANEYTFLGLAEHTDKRWGKKAFKDQSKIEVK